MKKLNLYLVLFVFAASVVSSCKKEEDGLSNNNNNNTNPLSSALGGSPTIPTGAAGALYAVNNHVISDDGYGGLQTDDIGTAYAWFENYTTTKDAGTVTCNGEEIVNDFGGLALPWYYTFGGIIDFITGGNTVDWEVTGNASNAITGFTHTDNTAFPKCNFSVPSSVNLNSSLTITSTNLTSNDAVFYTIYGSGNAKVTKTMAANATSASFTSAELKSVATSGGLIGIQVMPVKLTPVTKNGKTYYFVKQWAFAQFSTAQ